MSTDRPSRLTVNRPSRLAMNRPSKMARTVAQAKPRDTKGLRALEDVPDYAEDDHRQARFAGEAATLALSEAAKANTRVSELLAVLLKKGILTPDDLKKAQEESE